MANLIAAVGKYCSGYGYVIGKNGKMPWHCSADLKWFKETTMGHPIIMGRKTWECIGKPLHGRINIVVTSQSVVDSELEKKGDLVVANTIETALEKAKELSTEEPFIIGGAKIYKYALEHDLIDKIYLDFISDRTDGDSFININMSEWKQIHIPMVVKEDEAYACEYIKQKGKNNHVDEQYFELVNDIIKHGEFKNTRAGKTRSVFGRQVRFNLKDGLPLLTTKKVYTKGVIHELLWFLKGDTNIKYLVDNNVHIWDDDAYRYYIELNKKYRGPLFEDDEFFDKKRFLLLVQKEKTMRFDLDTDDGDYLLYKFGDLGPVYGKQWTNWNGHNQIKEVIESLKKNPDDRRMIMSAWNVGEISDMALPPCHFCCQFYTKKMTAEERIQWLKEHAEEKNLQFIGVDVNEITDEVLDALDVPSRKLSCCFHMRGTDCICGLPFNVTSYSILTHMIAQCVNMGVDELIYEVGDAHVYENHIEIYNQIQKNRNPHMYALPKLVLNPDIKNIEDFTYDDIKIEGYQSYPSIKYPLNTGLDKIN